MKIALWIVRVVVALILLQTLFFKFSGAPESIYIFETVGQEPWGRYGSGAVELVAAILLLIPRFSAIGALLSLGVISGAIFFHLTKLGIEVQGDGGTLFVLACVVWVGSVFLVWRQWRTLPLVGRPD